MNLSQLKKTLPRYFIPLALILLVISIFVIYILIKQGSKDSNVRTQSTKVIPPKEERANLPLEIQKIRQNIIDAKILEKNGDLLLFKNDAIEIEYIPSPDIFFVKILKEPPQTYKKQAQDWFLKFGPNQSDLCSLPVRFILDFSLKKTNPNFSPLPDGC